MSELIGGDETLFSLWPEHFLSKPDWSLNQQIVPIVFLDDGKIALRSDNGQIHLLDGLHEVEMGMGEDVLLPLPELEYPDADLPTISDTTINMHVQTNLDTELPLVDDLSNDKHLPALDNIFMPAELGGKDMQAIGDTSISDLTEENMPPSPMDIDLKGLAVFRCNYCTYSSADVPSLLLHFKTDHDLLTEPELRDESADNLGIQEVGSLSTEDSQEEEAQDQARNVVVYLCSECHENFSTVEECRYHMITNHRMVFKNPIDESVIDEAVEHKEATTHSPAEPDPSPTTFLPGPSPTHLPSTVLLPPSVIQQTPIVQSSVVQPIPVTQSPPVSQPPPVTQTPPVSQPPPFIILKKPRKVKPKDYDPEFEVKPYKCSEPYCVYKFKSNHSLVTHVECHLSDDSRKFCCPHCSMLFNKWGLCSMHLWKEHQVDVDLITCNVCNEYKATTAKKMKSHINIHSDERPYKCSVCEKGFKQQPQMINHMASVHNKGNSIPPKWYMSQKCEICFKTYADSKCLKKHMQAVHNKLKPYKCQICNHMCAHKAMLQAHYRQHTGEKPFACELCSYKTGDHNSLRRHMMRHTGKKPYRCPHCQYSCIQSSSLKSHVINRHPGQGGTYVCNICQYATVSEKSYANHISDHKLNLIPPSEVEVFPENVAAAHLVYRSLGASPSHIHCDVTASSTSRDGMKQTITISIPHEDIPVTDDEDTSQYVLGDVLDTGGITIPAEPQCSFS